MVLLLPVIPERFYPVSSPYGFQKLDSGLRLAGMTNVWFYLYGSAFACHTGNVLSGIQSLRLSKLDSGLMPAGMTLL